MLLFLWAGGTVAVYGRVFAGAITGYLHQPDVRARRELVASFALLLTALASALAITMILFGPIGGGIRGFAVAVALGAFTAAGAIMAFPDRRDA